MYTEFNGVISWNRLMSQFSTKLTEFNPIYTAIIMYMCLGHVVIGLALTNDPLMLSVLIRF